MILLITQARLSSSRLPEKVLKSIGNESLLSLHLRRLKRTKKIDKILVATTEEPGVEKIIQEASKHDVEVYQGSLNDVLDRFYHAAKKFQAEIIVRVTSDCPLIDPDLIDELIRDFQSSPVDYESNCLKPTLPDGMDAEVFTFSALEKAWKEAKLISEREHVTPYIWKNSDGNGLKLFQAKNWSSIKDYSHLRMTVDTQEDLSLIQALVQRLGPDCSWIDYVELLEKNPDVASLNKSISRNEGYIKSIAKDN